MHWVGPSAPPVPTCNVAGANLRPRRRRCRKTERVSGAVFHPELRRLARVLHAGHHAVELEHHWKLSRLPHPAHRVMSRCSPRQTVCGCGGIGPLHRRVSMPRLCGGFIVADTDRQARNRTTISCAGVRPRTRRCGGFDGLPACARTPHRRPWRSVWARGYAACRMNARGYDRRRE
jgi:hypothetical protein